MWEIKIETENYNKLYFKFKTLKSATSFIETAQEHCNDRLEITITKIDEMEGE